MVTLHVVYVIPRVVDRREKNRSDRFSMPRIAHPHCKVHRKTIPGAWQGASTIYIPSPSPRGARRTAEGPEGAPSPSRRRRPTNEQITFLQSDSCCGRHNTRPLSTEQSTAVEQRDSIARLIWRTSSRVVLVEFANGADRYATD